jgi:hypothetical protein
VGGDGGDGAGGGGETGDATHRRRCYSDSPLVPSSLLLLVGQPRCLSPLTTR